MTTDTVYKLASTQTTIGGKTVTVTGIAKGAGMIQPNMATMLSFVFTDAAIAAELLQPLAKRAADASFNRVTVDGDTSTNDSYIIAATGKAGNVSITSLEGADGIAPVSYTHLSSARSVCRKYRPTGKNFTTK